MATSCESSESSLNDCNDTYGHLLFFRKGGGPGLPYPLTLGETTIGYSLDADIRIKIQDDRLEEIHCTVQVDESGVAQLINKSSSSTVLVNDIPVDKFKILRNKDTVDVVGKTFQYINQNISDEEIQRFERTMPKFCTTPLKRRQTIAPLLSLKSSTPCSDIKTMVSFALSTHNRMRRSSNSALKIASGKRSSLTDQAKSPMKNLLKNKENFRRSMSASIPMEKRKSTVENDCSIKPSLSEITISDVDVSSVSNKSPLKSVPGQRRRTSLRKSASMSHIFSDVSTEFLSSNSFVLEGSLLSDDLEKTELQNSSVFSSTPKSEDLRPSLRSSTKNDSKLDNVTCSPSIVTSDLISFEDTMPIKNRSSPRISHVMKTVNESTSASAAGTVEGSVLDSTPKLQESESPHNSLSNILAVKNLLKTPSEIKSPHNDSTNILGVKRLLRTPREVKSPKNDLTNIAGAKNLLATPKYTESPQNDLTGIAGVKKLSRTPRLIKSPRNDLTNVVGVKKLLTTPKPQKSPKNDLTDIAGVKSLLTTPKCPKSPQNDLSNIVGVKKILRTPRQMKSPRNDLTNIVGVKKLLATPKQQKSPKNDLTNVAGVKRLLTTPKYPKSPKNDLSDIVGVKKLLKTPRQMKSPRNDLTNVGGLKKLLATPKQQKSPKNDLTNIAGVKKLLATPKYPNSPQNDLTDILGVKKLLKTPRQIKSPRNDLTKVDGVKKLFSTPKQQKSPKNDLTEVSGIKKLLRTPKEIKPPKNALDDLDGVAQLYEVHNLSKSVLIEDHSNLFDKLLDKKPLKTYRAQSISPLKNIHDNLRRKTMGDVSAVTSPRVANWVEEQKAIVRHPSAETVVDEVKPVVIVNPVPENIVKPKRGRPKKAEPFVHRESQEKDEEKFVSIIVDEKMPSVTRKGRSQREEITDNIEECKVATPDQPVVKRGRKRKEKAEEGNVPFVDEEGQPKIIRRGRSQKKQITDCKEETAIDSPAQPIVQRGRKKRAKAEEEDVPIVEEPKPEKPKIIRKGRSQKKEITACKKESETASPTEPIVRRESQKKGTEEVVHETEKRNTSRRGRSQKEKITENIKESDIASPAQTVVRRGRKRKEKIEEVDGSIVDDEGKPKNSKIIRRGRHQKNEIADNKTDSETASPAKPIVRRGRKKKDEENVPNVDEFKDSEKPKATRRGAAKKHQQEEQTVIKETEESLQIEAKAGRRTRRNVGGIKEESSADTMRTRNVKTEFNKYGEDFIHESPLKKKNTRRKN